MIYSPKKASSSFFFRCLRCLSALLRTLRLSVGEIKFLDFRLSFGDIDDATFLKRFAHDERQINSAILDPQRSFESAHMQRVGDEVRDGLI